MSQITTCPSCGTRFRVVADQLRISDGWVRCGQCQAVFDARNHLEGATTPPAAHNTSGSASTPAPVASGISPKPFGPLTSAAPNPRMGQTHTEASVGQLSHQQDAAREQERATASHVALPPATGKGYELPAPEWGEEIDFSGYQPDIQSTEEEESAARSHASASGDAVSDHTERTEASDNVSPTVGADTSVAATSVHRSADLQAARIAVAQAHDAAVAKEQGEELVRTEPLWDTQLPAAPKTDFPSLDLSMLQVSVATDPKPESVGSKSAHQQAPSEPLQVPDTSAIAANQASALQVSHSTPASDANEIRSSGLSDRPEVLSKQKHAVGVDLKKGTAIDPDLQARAPAWPDLDPAWSAGPAAPRVGQAEPVVDHAAAADPVATRNQPSPASEAPPADAVPPLNAVSTQDAETTATTRIDALEAVAQRLAQGEHPQELDTTRAHEFATAMSGDELLDTEPGFIREARRKAWWQKPAVRVAMGAAVVVLPVALMLQVALHERNALVAWQPSLRPALEFMCTALQCTLSPRQHIASMVVSGSSFTQHGADRSYLLHLSVQNKARTSLGMPALELTLTDAQDQAIARKVISAKELGAPVELAAGREWSGTVPVSTEGLNLQVAGFRLMLFYP